MLNNDVILSIDSSEAVGRDAIALTFISTLDLGLVGGILQ